MIINIKNHNGSATLLIVLAISAIVACCMTLWHGVSFFNDMCIQRQQYEQRYWLAEGILTMGIAICKNNYTKILQLKKKAFSINTGFWSIDAHKGFWGEIKVTVKEPSLHIQAVLYDVNNNASRPSGRDSNSIMDSASHENSRNIFALGCKLLPAKVKRENKSIKQFAKQFIVTNWQIYAI